MTDSSDQPTIDGPLVGEPAFEPPRPATDVARCPACLSPMRSDQRYCLECGERLAVDEIPPPPGGGSAFANRSTSLLAIAAVALIVVGVGLGWVALRDPNRGDTPDATVTATVITDTVITDTVITDTVITDTIITDTIITDTIITDTVITVTSPSGATWPVGKSGYAVILASKDSATFTEADAQIIAGDATAAGVPMVGVLDSSQFSTLNPGYWAVFSGPYTTLNQAVTAAATIQGQGYPEAYARHVQP